MTDLFNTSPTLVRILSALPPEQRAQAFRLVLEDESLLHDLFDAHAEERREQGNRPPVNPVD